MRTAFVKSLEAAAREDPSIMLLTGDLGFTVLEPFRDTLSRQYLNVGVAEQNMVGIAAGLALSGKRVFTYSIIPFATFRCLEQIRNDVCYHRLPVCIVGVGSGYSYGHQGSTHHALEDIAVMRSLSHMTAICPGDPVEAEAAVRAICTWNGPCYLRLGKAGEPRLHTALPTFTIGRAIRMQDGSDVTVIATGNMLETAVGATAILKDQGVRVRLVSMPTVKPIDAEEIRAAALETPLIVTLEEHSSIGGLGSAVAESLSLQGLLARHLLLSAPSTFAEEIGSQAYLRTRAGLSAQAVVDRILLARQPLATV